MKTTSSLLVPLILFSSLTACATLPRASAVPAQKTTQAAIPGIGDIRYFEGDPHDMARMKADIATLWPKQRARLRAKGIGAFPPVMIDVELNGERYSEMHVDGGTSTQVFIYPPAVYLAGLTRDHQIQRKRSLYIIMNEPIAQQWAETRRHIIDIAARALATVVHNQGIGDLFRIYLTAMRDNVDFNVAYIPETFSHPYPMVFNNDFMRSLYACGYQEATQGSPWLSHPPGLEARYIQNRE